MENNLETVVGVDNRHAGEVDDNPKRQETEPLHPGLLAASIIF